MIAKFEVPRQNANWTTFPTITRSCRSCAPFCLGIGHHAAKLKNPGWAIDIDVEIVTVEK